MVAGMGLFLRKGLAPRYGAAAGYARIIGERAGKSKFRRSPARDEYGFATRMA